jgi:hypothetical protein
MLLEESQRSEGISILIFQLGHASSLKVSVALCVGVVW